MKSDRWGVKTCRSGWTGDLCPEQKRSCANLTTCRDCLLQELKAFACLHFHSLAGLSYKNKGRPEYSTTFNALTSGLVFFFPPRRFWAAESSLLWMCVDDGYSHKTTVIFSQCAKLFSLVGVKMVWMAPLCNETTSWEPEQSNPIPSVWKHCYT